MSCKYFTKEESFSIMLSFQHSERHNTFRLSIRYACEGRRKGGAGENRKQFCEEMRD